MNLHIQTAEEGSAEFRPIPKGLHLSAQGCNPLGIQPPGTRKLQVMPRAILRSPVNAGFTVIEVIGVLTLLAIIALAVTASVIKRIDQGALTKETADLSAIGDAYTQYILKNKTIPSHTTWAAAVANEMALSTTAVATNSRRYARAFLVDPSLSIGGAGLPYTQTTNGTARPIRARVLLVSSLSQALPVSSGVALSSTEFEAIWAAPEGAKPTSATWTSWAGTGGDLQIKKLNLEPLFHQLIMVNRTTAGVGKFSIDNSPVLSLPTGGLGWDAYYIEGTDLGLRDMNADLRTRYLITRSISYVFEPDGWRGSITQGQNAYATPEVFVNEAKEFFDSQWTSGANNGSSQYAVMVAMHGFMSIYTLWANECPHFNRHGQTGATPTGVPEYDMLVNLGATGKGLDKYSSDLIQ